jgi:heme O synthase-like polyprenyltransferase
MKEYKIPPEGLASIRKRIVKRQIPMNILMVVIIVAVLTAQNIYSHGYDPMITIITGVVILVGLSLLSLRRARRNIRRQMEVYETYTVTLTENLLSRESDKLPTIAIYRREIKQISLTRSGGLVVKGNDPRAVIGIPREIEDYEELRDALAQIMPFKPLRNEALLKVSGFLVGIAVIGLFICVLAVHNRIIVTVCGALYSGVLIWSFIAIRRNRNIDHKGKRAAWAVLYLVALAVAMVIAKWMIPGF